MKERKELDKLVYFVEAEEWYPDLEVRIDPTNREALKEWERIRKKFFLERIPLPTIFFMRGYLKPYVVYVGKDRRIRTYSGENEISKFIEEFGEEIRKTYIKRRRLDQKLLN